MTDYLRGFAQVSPEEWETSSEPIRYLGAWRYEDIILPKSSTENSAGCDIYASCNFSIVPEESFLMPTGFKAFMQPDEMLIIVPRSSLGFKHGLMLANTMAIGDSDYFNNRDNEGHYFIKLTNRGKNVIKIRKSDRIAQAIFMPFLRSNGHISSQIRTGGLGHTGQ